jgi:hypothetical protein
MPGFGDLRYAPRHRERRCAVVGALTVSLPPIL